MPGEGGDGAPPHGSRLAVESRKDLDARLDGGQGGGADEGHRHVRATVENADRPEAGRRPLSKAGERCRGSFEPPFSGDEKLSREREPENPDTEM